MSIENTLCLCLAILEEHFQGCIVYALNVVVLLLNRVAIS